MSTLNALLRQKLPYLDDEEAVGVADELVAQVLMQRDCHFSGSFEAMIEAYRAGTKASAAGDLTLRDVEKVAAMEREAGANLAPVLLSATQIEQVALSRATYRALEQLYENGREGSLELAIADLILTEELEPQEEIRAVVAHGAPALPLLTSLLESSSFGSPYYPGYGWAPVHAAQALGELGDATAIESLYSAMHRSEESSLEEACLQALIQLGRPALQFIARRVASRPLTSENDTAAFALSCFPPTPETRKVAEQLLQDSEIQKRHPLSDYLRLIV